MRNATLNIAPPRRAVSISLPGRKWFRAVETGLVVGILDASGIAVKTKNPLVQGWRIKNRFDCGFAILSFVVFVLLEAGLVYPYFILVRVL